MKHPTVHWHVVNNNSGQALTEFAIAIPIVLLFFLTLLQYFQVVQASQLGNYAAYVAARVYAVRASVDPNNANSQAQNAVALVLAPIARPYPGEPFYSFFSSASSASLAALSSLGPLNTLLGGSAAYAAKYAEGWAYVLLFRLQPNILGGSLNITTSGTPMQADAAINYPQPVFVPGLAEIWDIVTGERIYHSLQPLSANLTGFPAELLPTYSLIDQLQEQLSNLGIPSNLPSSFYIIPPYINVQSKCSVGYESWGSPSAYNAALANVNKYSSWTGWGSASQWQPRLPSP